MKEKSDIEAFILAGGASSRMKSDKANLRLLGKKTFAERAAGTLSAIAAPENIRVVGNLQQNSIEQNLANLQILPDVIETTRRGSIIGLHTALFHARANWAAILACDLPFAAGALFERLVFFSASENYQAVIPIQPDGRIQPLCALYKPKICLPIVEKMINENVWSLQKLAAQVKTRVVEFAELRDLPLSEFFFFNVNTPEEYERAREIDCLVNS